MERRHAAAPTFEKRVAQFLADATENSLVFEEFPGFGEEKPG
jgi:hypothetical protein